jgi:DNA-binding NarL/FixJ family response regulator
MITVFLADDHQMFRQGLRPLLDSTSDIKVVGETSDGQACLQEIKKLKPDITRNRPGQLCELAQDSPL